MGSTITPAAFEYKHDPEVEDGLTSEVTEDTLNSVTKYVLAPEATNREFLQMRLMIWLL